MRNRGRISTGLTLPCYFETGVRFIDGTARWSAMRVLPARHPSWYHVTRVYGRSEPNQRYEGREYAWKQLQASEPESGRRRRAARRDVSSPVPRSQYLWRVRLKL
ncbi:hypothetical protein J6590_002200 [Homalodisca vitripennis]|nr:hypothetical protein J6590_002200 [Homalodisca vitripennis]